MKVFNVYHILFIVFGTLYSWKEVSPDLCFHYFKKYKQLLKLKKIKQDYILLSSHREQSVNLIFRKTCNYQTLTAGLNYNCSKDYTFSAYGRTFSSLWTWYAGEGRMRIVPENWGKHYLCLEKNKLQDEIE
jgi:hypothetical protein